MDQGVGLGTWVLAQRNRRKRNKLDQARIHELNKLGFLWDPYNASWEQHFEVLKQYIQRTGNSAPKATTHFSGLAIGAWLSRQKADQRSGKLVKDKELRLKSIGVDWRFTNDSLWERGLGALEEFKAKHGHVKVPSGYEKDGVRLASWMQTRRNDFRNGRLDKSKVKALDAVGFEWEPMESWWLPGVESFKRYVAENGPDVPPQSTVFHGFKLGSWLGSRRLDKKNGRLSPERVKELDRLGMVWDVEERNWTEFLHHLSAFVKKNGHGNVPQAHLEGSYPLGRRVAGLRASKKTGKLESKKLREASAAGIAWTSGRYRDK